ncbi:MAG: hypothetical protein IJT46_03520 [Bacteroidaceae bacterium]|nr:hypothetical protein [Bacteroidaceae bacterium]
MTNKKAFTYIILFSLILLCSCGQSISENEARRDDFSSYQELKRTYRTHEEDLFLGRPQSIFLIEDRLAIYDIYDENYILWLTKDFKALDRNFHKGTGPGEFSSAFRLYPSEDGKLLTVCEYGRDAVKTYKMEDAINGRLTHPVRVDSVRTRGIRPVPLNNNYIAAEAKGDMKLFTLLNQDGEEIARFGDFTGKISDGFKADYDYLWMFIQIIVAANPEKNIVVGAGYFTDLLCFYKISEKGEATLLNQYRTYDTELTVESFENGVSAQYNEKTMDAYRTLYPTKNFLFALYRGCLMKELRAHQYSYLQVFDWEGNFIKGYKLDAPLTDMVIDEENRMVYGLRGGAEPHIRTYKLEGLN